MLESNDLKTQPMYNVSSYASILSLIISGAGIGILPKKPASFYVSKGIIKELRSIKLKQEPHQIFVYLRRSSNRSNSIKSFIEKIILSRNF